MILSKFWNGYVRCSRVEHKDTVFRMFPKGRMGGGRSSGENFPATNTPHNSRLLKTLRAAIAPAQTRVVAALSWQCFDGRPSNGLTRVEKRADPTKPSPTKDNPG